MPARRPELTAGTVGQLRRHCFRLPHLSRSKIRAPFFRQQHCSRASLAINFGYLQRKHLKCPDRLYIVHIAVRQFGSSLERDMLKNFRITVVLILIAVISSPAAARSPARSKSKIICLAALSFIERNNINIGNRMVFSSQSLSDKSQWINAANRLFCPSKIVLPAEKDGVYLAYFLAPEPFREPDGAVSVKISLLELQQTSKPTNHIELYRSKIKRKRNRCEISRTTGV